MIDTFGYGLKPPPRLQSMAVDASSLQTEPKFGKPFGFSMRPP